MYDICCIGHITLDKVVTPGSELFMAGGTSVYFSNAIHQMDVKYCLVTSLAHSEMPFADSLRQMGIDVKSYPSAHTVYFENIYSQDLDHRTQRVLQTADPFNWEQLACIDAAVYHLGPLLANDIDPSLVEMLSKKGMVSLDVQGYLRSVENQKVCAVDWAGKLEVLPFIHTLKANETEAEVLTGESDPALAALRLHAWGVKEVVITLGSRGSLIYADEIMYDVPAYPATAVDATGCGDTYMAGYLYQRLKGLSPLRAGKFAAAMASLKIEKPGPFKGNEAAVIKELENNTIKW